MSETMQSTYQAEMHQLGGTYYKLESLVGKGSYGLVFKAVDTRTGEPVAVKRVHEEILNGTNALTVRRIWQEILVNSYLCHPNIIYLREILRPRSANFSTLYMIFDFMEIDLSKVLKNKDDDFSEEHVKWIICQVLRALDYVHQSGIVHRDVTPANLLLSQDCDVKLCDFGLARDNHGHEMTEYVVMRWYRAPELVMEDSDYTAAVDVWACGCIMGQMFHKNSALFRGETKVKQLDAIIKVIGTPGEDDLGDVGCNNAKTYVRTRLAGRTPVDFRTFFSKPEGGELPEDALDLLQRMLVFNPKKRITVQDALQHRYLRDTNQWFETNHQDLATPPQHVNVDMPPDRDDVASLKRMILEQIDKIQQRNAKASRKEKGISRNNSCESTTSDGVGNMKSSPLLNNYTEFALDEEEYEPDYYDDVWD